MTQKQINDITYEIIGAAIDVHRVVGPGLLESVYHKCILHELRERNLDVNSEFRVPLKYKGMDLGIDLKADLIVNSAVIVELKSVDEMMPVYEAQLLTYMRLLQIPKGLLINFNCTNIFKQGQRTFVNELYAKLPRI